MCIRPMRVLTATHADRMPKADVNWLSQQLTAVVDSLMPTSEECARQAAAFDKVSAQLSSAIKFAIVNFCLLVSFHLFSCSDS